MALVDAPCPGKSKAYTVALADRGCCVNNQRSAIAPEAVDENHDVIRLTHLGVSQVVFAHFRNGVSVTGFLLFRIRRDVIRLELIDERVDVRIADSARREHPEQCTDGQYFVRLSNLAPQDPGVQRFKGIGDLFGFDLHELVAELEFDTFLDQPFHDLAFDHRQAPLGHRDSRDLSVAHAAYSTVFRTAASIFSGLGM